MNSQNVLKPYNRSVRDMDRSPLRKRSRIDSSDSDNLKWGIKSKQNDYALMEEMGLGMLDSDDLSDCRSDDVKPDCSDVVSSLQQLGDNESNPDSLNVEAPGSCASTFSEGCTPRKSLPGEDKKLIDSKELNDFCVFRLSAERNVDQTDWFAKLSDEIVLLVFRWLPKTCLPNVALVSKRFNMITQDESLWTRLDCGSKCLEPGSLGYIISRQVMVLRLAQTQISDPSFMEGCKAFAPEFSSKLMYLDLSMAIVSTDTLIVLFKKCKRLKKLSLEACTVNDRVCCALSQNHNLEVLNLTMTEGLSLIGVTFILDNCIKLKELNISWTSLADKTVEYLCRNLPQRLDRLNIAGCRKSLTNMNVVDLVHACPNLMELDLSDCTALTEEVINQLVLLEELNFLALSRCYGIAYTALSKLQKLPALSFLDIHGGHLLESQEVKWVRDTLGPRVQVNKFLFSSVARPTVGARRSSIWGLRVRD